MATSLSHWGKDSCTALVAEGIGHVLQIAAASEAGGGCNAVASPKRRSEAPAHVL
jgi:hypothetical protein